jgi:aminoglycoside phosphotransferase family enzyme
MFEHVRENGGSVPDLAEKVAWLTAALSSQSGGSTVELRETHMSWVFLAGDRAYKLKKPVRFPYLDFSTVERRHVACRAELELNRRLARDVYLEILPITVRNGSLSLAGEGVVVDWLVVMRRLEQGATLEEAIVHDRVEIRQLDALVDALSQFYRHAKPANKSPSRELADWQQSLADDRRILLEPALGVPANRVRYIDFILRSYIRSNGDQLIERVHKHRIVDGHGDLRPEHIWLNHGIRIIDCLEFNARLRSVDPFDELAFLAVECDRLGASWVGQYVLTHIRRRLADDVPASLFIFYRCHRAMLRARLAIAHLLEPNPRLPEKWPRRTRAYLDIAATDATLLRRFCQNTTRSLSD